MLDLDSLEWLGGNVDTVSKHLLACEPTVGMGEIA